MSSFNDGNITIQNSLFYENKTGALMGGIPGLTKGKHSFLRNVSSNTSHRHPNIRGGEQLDAINNLIHNWRYRVGYMSASVAGDNLKLNRIGNYYQSGANTLASTPDISLTGLHKIGTGAGNGNPQIYSECPRLMVGIHPTTR